VDIAEVCFIVRDMPGRRSAIFIFTMNRGAALRQTG
jgi:hypothetical protein